MIASLFSEGNSNVQSPVMGMRNNPQVLLQHQQAQQPGQMIKQVPMGGQQMNPHASQMQGNANQVPANSANISSPQFVHTVRESCTNDFCFIF